MISKRTLLQCAVAGALAAPFFSASVAQEEKILRVTPYSDLKILDPIWTTSFVTRNHGYAIYDT